jgi:hypothetical protein
MQNDYSDRQAKQSVILDQVEIETSDELLLNTFT